MSFWYCLSLSCLFLIRTASVSALYADSVENTHDLVRVEPVLFFPNFIQNDFSLMHHQDTVPIFQCIAQVVGYHNRRHFLFRRTASGTGAADGDDDTDWFPDSGWAYGGTGSQNSGNCHEADGSDRPGKENDDGYGNAQPAPSTVKNTVVIRMQTL